MSIWSRFANVFRRDDLVHEIDEELNSHIEEAIEQGRDPAEVRRAFGSLMRQREASRDVKISRFLDSLLSDASFGWRQLLKRKMTSAAAILSLALAMGACTSMFRIIDALFWRPLPVAAAERLYLLVHQGVDFDGSFQTSDGWLYPMFRQMRSAVKEQAEVIGISQAEHTDVTYGSDQQTEKAYLQYVSGWMFRDFGIRPALGRLLTEGDDLKPGAHPVAVLSYDYWTRRFGKQNISGRIVRLGNDVFTIVGVAGKGFTGIEPGTMTDIFVPTMMNPNVDRSDFYWIRTLVVPKAGVPFRPVAGRLQVVYRSFETEQLKRLSGFPKRTLDGIVNQKVQLEPAVVGVSDMQEEYRVSLTALGILVCLVLLIACVNVANLMTAQAAARAREMALRVAIGAGRLRLVQLVLVESATLAIVSSGLGAAFAWWAAPFVVSRVNPAENPARLVLPADFRVLLFVVLLTLVVTALFGLTPALRASTIKPSTTLKGGSDPHSRRRLMYLLSTVQVTFGCFVIFVATLFVTTLSRLSHQPTGFVADQLLTLDTVAKSEEPPAIWNQIADKLRQTPGVESVALADWPLLSENVRGGYISVAGANPFPELAFFLKVSPRWFRVMKIALVDGREFQQGDVFPRVAIVNEAFTQKFLKGQQRPVGSAFTTALEDRQIRLEVIGVAKNARYSDLRGPMPPIVYFPFIYVDHKGMLLPRKTGTFLVRTFGSSRLTLASTLRHQVLQAAPEFRVTSIRTQSEIDAFHTIRERLVAMLGLFFSAVALLLTGIGLFGVLDYSVFQRQREIGIRMALGAQPKDIFGEVALGVLWMIGVGAAGGICLGAVSVHYVESLLYQTRVTDLSVICVPLFLLTTVALGSAMPALVHAIRIDPVKVLHAE